DLGGYDLVLSTSHCVAKGVRPAPDAVHVSYLHTPMRYIWHLYDEYARDKGPVSRAAMAVAAHHLRIWDVASSDRVDHFLANSDTVRRRIEQLYRRDADVIHPPVDTHYFTPSGEHTTGGVTNPGGGTIRNDREYYLMVTALVPYKRIDLAMRAFAGSGRRLI